jgi:glycosyltransferase involved in cell wall biosynthesis
MQTKVSMVIPCYNKEQYIGDMLQTVHDQRWDNIEVIFVNDGSSDGTREIISEWEPRLCARGYAVLVVDQENQGLAASVRNGLARVTGEGYVCMPDCDDLLHPEYVSRMADWLDKHPDDVWVTCDTKELSFDCGDCDGGGIAEYKYRLLESYLLHRVPHAVWLYLIRFGYMKKCGVPNAFPVEQRVTQEPQIWIPLSLGGARPVHIPEPLYDYVVREGSIITSLASFENCLEFLDSWSALVMRTLVKCDIPEEKKARYVAIAEIGSVYHIVSCAVKYSHERAFVEARVNELVDKINTSRLLNFKIPVGAVNAENIFAFYRTFSNRVIGYRPKHAGISRKPGGRIVGYAAYSETARKAMPMLAGTELRPDVLWDIAAKPGAEAFGIPVAYPDFDALRSNDTVLVLLTKAVVVKEVSDRLNASRAAANVCCYYDLIDHLAHDRFPQFDDEGL